MPITDGSIIRMKVFQEMQGQQILNVMHYEVTGGDIPVTDPAIVDLCRGYMDVWVAPLRARVTTALTWNRVECEVLNTPWYGVYAYPTPLAGLSASDPLPIFNACSIQHVRSNKITRHGWTRLAGMTETDNQAGNISLDWRNIVEDWADAVIRPAVGAGFVNLPLYSASDEQYGEVACQNIIWGGNDPGFPLGRYQATGSYVVKARISTQNTRKIGSGS